MIARSTASAYFLEAVVGKSEVQMLKRRGARTDLWGTLFLRRGYLLCLPLAVIRVELRLPFRPAPWSTRPCACQAAIAVACMCKLL